MYKIINKFKISKYYKYLTKYKLEQICNVNCTPLHGDSINVCTMLTV